MNVRPIIGVAVLAVIVTACESPVEVPLVDDEAPLLMVAADQQSHTCNDGDVIKAFASYWPWSHGVKFPPVAPPPGSMKQFVEVFGPVFGFSSIRELQENIRNIPQLFAIVQARTGCTP